MAEQTQHPLEKIASDVEGLIGITGTGMVCVDDTTLASGFVALERGGILVAGTTKSQLALWRAGALNHRLDAAVVYMPGLVVISHDHSHPDHRVRFEDGGLVGKRHSDVDTFVVAEHQEHGWQAYDVSGTTEYLPATGTTSYILERGPMDPLEARLILDGIVGAYAERALHRAEASRRFAEQFLE